MRHHGNLIDWRDSAGSLCTGQWLMAHDTPSTMSRQGCEHKLRVMRSAWATLPRSRTTIAPRESIILQWTGLIVTCGVLFAAATSLLAILRPSTFEGPGIARPSGPMTVAEQVQFAQAEATEQSDARDTGLKVAAGIGALAAGLLAWGRLEINRDERRLGRASHLTDRYSRAVEQLGHAADDVQLGGVYALEQLGRDSEQNRVIVIEVLCAFVRVHNGPIRRVDSSVALQPITVQAALKVLGRNRKDWHGVEYDLANTDLRGAELRGLDYSDCNFSGSNLGGVNFAGVSLSHANLSGASLRGADLTTATGLTTEQIASAVVDQFTLLPGTLPTSGSPSQLTGPAAPLD
jgi:Pentapeptide repeats (8 copies)